MAKVLITGISGFAGGYLASELLSQKKHQIVGTYLFEKSLKSIKTDKNMEFCRLDLMESVNVKEVIAKVRPDFIFHLAALTSPANSFNNPNETLTNNISAQLNLLEAVKSEGLMDTKILIISSGDIYGRVRLADLPINENTAFRPDNPYAVSKIAQDYLGLQYFLSYKMPIIRVRPFNHIGPGQSPLFVVSSFAKKIADIEKGTTPATLTVGNLDAKRDFTDVRDMVRAYVLAMEKGIVGEVYNIGSGTSHKIGDILEKLLSFSKVKISVVVDKKLLRPSDIPELRSDSSAFYSITGWTPQVPIDQTLKETLDYWRNIV